MMRAICTGILGQDSSYLAELLIEKNYDVYGVYRRISAGINFDNIKNIKDHPRLHLIAGDLCDYSFISQLISDVQPDLMFNAGAMSHVHQSFKEPIQTFRINAEAVIAQLEAIKKYSPKTKFCQSSTSEMLGGLDCPENGYNEDSPLRPRSPYAIAKVAAHHAIKHYRDTYNLFACSSIGFNHSSCRRGYDFATRKISKGVSAIKLGKQQHLYMGNLAARRGETHSKDVIKAQYMMLQQNTAQDYVVASGVEASIGEMLQYVCSLADLDFNDVYRQDEKFMRPSDVPFLKGDAAKLRSLGWEPQYTWQELLKEMYQHDLKELSK